jgi:beta-glucosidase
MFHKDFVFGVATSSYQIEGTKNDFKSIWDMDYSKIHNNDHGIIACDHVSLYKEDIQLIKSLGVDYYRLSFSWARLEISENSWSESGIQFYLDLLKAIKKEGIKVSATLYHWDMPLWLYQKGVGFDNKEIVTYFLEYSKKAFELFDEFVDQWTTINEPWCVSFVGYLFGGHSPWVKNLNQAVLAQYYTLICHKEVYHYYHQHYHKPIGIVLNLSHVYQTGLDHESKEAKAYADMFFNRVFLDPLFLGIYPKRYLDRLKALNIDTSFIDVKAISSLKDQLDFLGINTYSHFVSEYEGNSDFLFKRATTHYPKTEMGWDINPSAFLDLMNDLRSTYKNIPIYITENGAAFKDIQIGEKIFDHDRIAYYESYLKIIQEIHVSHNIKGYFAWSLMDNFEWAYGYEKRFGIIYVDFKTLKRYPKESYYFYQKVIKEKHL